MNFAFTSLAVVIAAIMTSHVSKVILILVSLIFVPIASKASALIWLGEYNRSQRAGRGISNAEKGINDLLGGQEPHVSWETSLISESTHMGYPYVATVLFLLSTGIFGELLGGYYLTLIVPKGNQVYVFVAGGAVLGYALLIESLFIRFFRRRWKAIRTYSHSG
jgi:hypothetical protein